MIIKAAVSHAFGQSLQIEDVELCPPRFGEVQVKLSAVAICHSDIVFAEGHWGGDLPAIYGHEAAGHISAIGEGVSGYEEGQPVIVTLIRFCGACAPCCSGKPVSCATPSPHSSPIATLEGKPVVKAMNCGAFAEQVVVDQSQIAAIPEDMAMDVASLLSCGVITGIGAAVNAANIRPGQTVVVVGAGGVGLNAIQGARLCGAARIVAVDLLEEKLADALEFGATDAVRANNGDPWEHVRSVTNGNMADCVLVSVGAVSAYEEAPNYLKPGGKVVMVGMTHSGAMARYEPVNIASSGQSMIGTKMGDVVLRRDIPWLIDLYQQGRLKLDELVSRRWRLDEINEAIADTKAGKARRNVVVFDETQ